MPAVEAPPSVAEAASEASAMGGGGRSGSESLAGKQMSSVFDALEKKGSPQSAEANTVSTKPLQPQKPKVEAPKTEQKPPEKPAPKQEETPKPEETAKVEEAPKPAEQPKTPEKAKKPSDFLREELTKSKAELTTLKGEVEKLRKAPTEAPEFKSLQEKYAKLEKEAAQLRDDQKLHRYEKSEEFKQRFETPFEESYAYGRSKANALKVTLPDGTERAGKPEDFDLIMSKSEEEAYKLIDEMYGTGSRSQIMTLAREKVMEKFQARKAALEEAGKNLGEREKQTKEFYDALNGEVKGMWEKHTKPDAIPEKHKPHLTPKDDPEKSLLEKGYAQADRAAREDARDPNLTPEQREAIVGRAAAMRNRAAAYPLLIHRLELHATRISELEAELKAYQDSEPGKGDADAAEEAPAEAGQSGTMAGALSNLEKKATPVYY